ncbi:MAG: hypothetical protein ABDH49_02440 [Candidatus Hydrothermales bacterium]
MIHIVKKEHADSLLSYLKNIKEDVLLFFGVRDEAFSMWSKELDEFFKEWEQKYL